MEKRILIRRIFEVFFLIIILSEIPTFSIIDIHCYRLAFTNLINGKTPYEFGFFYNLPFLIFYFPFYQTYLYIGLNVILYVYCIKEFDTMPFIVIIFITIRINLHDFNFGNTNLLICTLLILSKKVENHSEFFSGVLIGISCFKLNVILISWIFLMKEKHIIRRKFQGFLITMIITWFPTLIFVNSLEEFMRILTLYISIDGHRTNFFGLPYLPYIWLYYSILTLYDNKYRYIIQQAKLNFRKRYYRVIETLFKDKVIENEIIDM